MTDLLNISPLGFPWETADPFLFCAYHLDHYPRGNDLQGPAASLKGRNLGTDFTVRDGWRMYHGEIVPGFPQHPHRGFETVTIVRQGHVDHSDSLGATARYGGGDTQWMTAGAGIVHAEMFPLSDVDAPNPLELFQVWLNLPAKSKMVDPHFSMLWAESIPLIEHRDAKGRKTQITIVAGSYGKQSPPKPPPASWAANPEHDVAIWTLGLEGKATFTLPPAKSGSSRALYFHRGGSVTVGGEKVNEHAMIRLRPEAAIEIVAGAEAVDFLLLQGQPIKEQVAHHGPFVMNTRQELQQAFADYQRTGFGGWPWPSHGPVHAATSGRFAVHADGRKDAPKT